jgi:hypothetical protein
MKNIHSYFTNSNNDLLQRQICSGVSIDNWYSYNFNNMKWVKTLNPMASYFNSNLESIKTDTSIGILEINEEQMLNIKNK